MGSRQTQLEDSDARNQVSWRALLRSGYVSRFLVLCLAIWLHAANSMLAATTLPSAVAEFGGAHLISWAFTLYLLGSILAGAGAGLLVRRFGLQRGFVLSSALYAVGSGICALAWSMEIVVFGRLLQGLGGGALLALTYIALNRNFPRAFLPRLLALISVTWSTSSFCGPLIGGLFSTYGVWRLGFAAFVLQAVIFLVLVVLTGEEDDTSDVGDAARFPIWRLAILSTAIMSVAIAGALFTPIGSPVLCILALLLIYVFLRLDRSRGAARMYPEQTLNINHPVGAGLFMILCASMATMSFLVYGPFFLELLYGVSPLAAGYIVASEAVAWGTCAILFSGFSKAHETWAIRIGTSIVALGVAGFAFAMPSGNIVLVIACGVGQGAGFGLMWGYLVRRLTAHVAEAERDVMSSSIPTTQQIGFAVGAAAAGIVANAAGLGDGISHAAARSVSFWIFIAFVPLVILALPAAWKLSR